MSKPKYSIEQISIGDEIVYKEKYINHENGLQYWTVVAKLDRSLLLIELNQDNFSAKRMIEVADVKQLVAHH